MISKTNYLSLLASALLLSGCLTVPQKPEERRATMVSSALEGYKANDCTRGNNNIDYLMTDVANTAAIKNVFASTPNARICYLASLRKEIDDLGLYGFGPVLRVANKIEYISSNSISDAETSDNLRSYLKNVAVSKFNDGTLKITFSDDIHAIPVLNTIEFKEKIALKTIDEYIKDGGHPKSDLPKLVEYIKTQPKSSAAHTKILASLQQITFRSRDLEFIKEIAPDFAKEAKDKLTIKMSVGFKSFDRIESSDMLSKLKSDLKGIDWQPEDVSEYYKIVVEKIKYDERIRPESTETITYAQHEVDTMKAVMLMPRNASYLYDRIAGGGEVEYGYAIDFYKNGKRLNEELIRGKEIYSTSRCQNKRIQNVFGGVSSAGFDANDDMKSKCYSRSNGSIVEARDKINTNLIDKIKSIPEISKIQAMN